MLLRFGVENYRSIASYQELQLTASTLADSDVGLLPIFDGAADGKGTHVVPVAGVYGANASGKSTLLLALQFFSAGIVSSHSGRASSTGTPYEPFLLDDESKNKPSRFDADIVLDGIRYHYGYMVDGKRIVQEWLYSFDLRATRKVKSVLFVRETDENLATEHSFGKSLKGENKQIASFVRPNSLFLSVAAQNAHPQVTPIFNFFFAKVVHRLAGGIGDELIAEQLSTYFGVNSDRQRNAVEFLKAADVGIEGMDFSKKKVDEKTLLMLEEFEQVLRKHMSSDNSETRFEMPKERARVSLLHKGKGEKSYPIKLDAESTGTLALLQLLGPVFARLSEGGVLMVDELNSALHPLVSRELIKLFSDPKTNVGHAQLIFSTHDTNLLTGKLLRRDQVWFTEKDTAGATHIYALSDIKVRASDNFEQGYLQGRFGAIPFVGCGLEEFARSFETVVEKAV